MNAPASPLPLAADPASYYAFGQRADRIVAIGLGFDGSFQPMKRAAATAPASPTSAWNDVGGTIAGGNAPSGITTLTATVPNGNSALGVIEFVGWSLPYPPHIANILGPSWPFGQTEVTYPAGSVGGVECVRQIVFQFTPAVDGKGNKTATLTWTTGKAPVTASGSVLLDANNLKFAFIVLRLNGANKGQIVSSSPMGTDPAGNQINTLAF